MPVGYGLLGLPLAVMGMARGTFTVALVFSGATPALKEQT
jgi:hypothetical protein